MARKKSSAPVPDKGPHRPVYESLLTHPRFMPLGVEARALWWALKLTLGVAGIRRVYDEELADASAIPVGERLDGARQELIEHRWLQVEGRIHWLVDGFDNEPYNQGPNARRNVELIARGLHGAIVDRFLERYGFAKGSGEGSGEGSGKGPGKVRSGAHARTRPNHTIPDQQGESPTDRRTSGRARPHEASGTAPPGEDKTKPKRGGFTARIRREYDRMKGAET